MKPLVYSLTLTLIAGTASFAQQAPRALTQGNEGQTAQAEGNLDAEASDAIGNENNNAQRLDSPATEAAEEVLEVPAETAREVEESANEAVDNADRAVEAEAQRVEESIPAAPTQNDVEEIEANNGTPAIEENVREAQQEINEAPPAQQRQNMDANRTIGTANNPNQLGVYLDDSAQSGLTVGRVEPNSPAARMGLRPGDRIERFNNQQYANQSAFNNAMRNWSPNGAVPMTYWRDGRQYSTTIPADAWNTQQNQTYSAQQSRQYEADRPVYQDEIPAPPGDDAYPMEQSAQSQQPMESYAAPATTESWSSAQPCPNAVVSQPVYNYAGPASYDNCDRLDRCERRALRQQRRCLRRAY